MTPVEALKLALSKETASIELYKKISKEHSVIRELVTFLLNEEYKHKKLIEDKIAEVTRY